MQRATSALTRQRLYDLVWTVPREDLAGRLKLTVKELAKVCQGLDIPKPNSSCRTRMALGKPIKKVPLPLPPRDKLLAGEHMPLIKGGLHSLAKATQAWVKDISVGSDDVVNLAEYYPCLDIRVRPRNLSAAIGLFHLVMVRLERLGCEVELSAESGVFLTYAKFKGVRVPIRVAEKSISKGRMRGRDLRFDCLAFEYRWGMTDDFWVDGDLKREGSPSRIIESRAQSVKNELKYLCNATTSKRERDAEDAEENRKMKEINRRYEIEAKLKGDLKSLEIQTAYWLRAARLREYIRAVAAKGGNDPAIRKWVKESRRAVNQMDPVKAGWRDEVPAFLVSLDKELWPEPRYEQRSRFGSRYR